jgi:ABC-type microcin C transport system duplicated ATPase subunit YejF
VSLAVVGESGSASQLFCRCWDSANGRATVDPAAASSCWALTTPRCEGVRGGKAGIVFEDPLSSLTPHLRIERQLVSAGRARPAPDA